MGFLLLSCTAFYVNTADISNLRGRVDAYYKAKISVDFREAFKYENMRFDERFTEKFYVTNAIKSSMEYLDASILSIDLNEKKDVAAVRIKLKFKLQPMQGFEKFRQMQEITIEDKWVYKQGDWYHIIQGLTRDW